MRNSYFDLFWCGLNVMVADNIWFSTTFQLVDFPITCILFFLTFHKPMSTLFGIWNLRFSYFVPRKPRDNYIWHFKFGFLTLDKPCDMYIWHLKSELFFKKFHKRWLLTIYCTDFIWLVLLCENISISIPLIIKNNCFLLLFPIINSSSFIKSFYRYKKKT